MTAATRPPTNQPAAETAVAVFSEEQALTPFQVIERVITAGDLAKMTPKERVSFYWRTCESLGLNPLTRPFEYINLDGKLTLYTRKDATDQLRRINGVTVTGLRREKDDDLGLLTVYATGRDHTGREDEASGVVFVKGLAGNALANAVMKAETKAKRRLTLSLVGLGFLDESEIEGAARADVDPATGEITTTAKPASLLDQVRAQQAAMATPAADHEPAGDVIEGTATDVPAGLTREQLLEELAKAGIAADYAGQVARHKFQLGPNEALTDVQRAELLAELLAPAGAAL